MLIGSRICCIDWHINGWPWVTLNGHFIRIVRYLCSSWTSLFCLWWTPFFVWPDICCVQMLLLLLMNFAVGICPFFSFSTASIIAISVVHSTLDYCNSLWYNLPNSTLAVLCFSVSTVCKYLLRSPHMWFWTYPTGILPLLMMHLFSWGLLHVVTCF